MTRCFQKSTLRASEFSRNKIADAVTKWNKGNIEKQERAEEINITIEKSEEIRAKRLLKETLLKDLVLKNIIYQGYNQKL